MHSGVQTSRAHVMESHSRVRGNPVLLPVPLDTRFRGYDAEAGGKQSLYSITQWIGYKHAAISYSASGCIP